MMSKDNMLLEALKRQFNPVPSRKLSSTTGSSEEHNQTTASPKQGPAMASA
jgi:hypothetical protein